MAQPFHSDITADFHTRLPCYLAIIGRGGDRGVGYWERLEGDIRRACPEAIQHVNELLDYAPEQHAERLGKILDAMESQEFGRAVAFYHRISHKLSIMNEVGDTHGAPWLKISEPDDYISDAALDVYAGELKKKWTLQRAYYELQVPVYELYREAAAASPDAGRLETNRVKLLTATEAAAALLIGYASSAEYTPYAGVLNQTADDIEKAALPLRSPPLAADAARATAESIGRKSGRIVTDASQVIYAKLVESDGIAVLESPENPGMAVDTHGGPPQPTTGRGPEVV